MAPNQISVKNTEHGHQAALFAWASMAEMYGFEVASDARSYSKQGLAEVMRQVGVLKPVSELHFLHAIPNGGARDARTAALMKAEGVKSGIADIFLPYPCYFANNTFHGLYIELKTATGVQSPTQKEFQTYCYINNYVYKLCRSWKEAAEAIYSYLQNSQNS